MRIRQHFPLDQYNFPLWLKTLVKTKYREISPKKTLLDECLNVSHTPPIELIFVITFIMCFVFLIIFKHQKSPINQNKYDAFQVINKNKNYSEFAQRIFFAENAFQESWK